METQELLLTAGRALAVYLFMLVVLRLLGKRTVGNFSAFDLLVALMLGEVVDEIIYGDVSMAQGGIAILVIALAHYLTGWLAYSNKMLDKLLEGSPTIVIRDGQFQQNGMHQERLNKEEIESLLRQQSIDDVREVKLAIVEPDGKLSVILQSWAEPVQKGDLKGEEADQKRADTAGQEEPTDEMSTISAQTLGKAA